MIDRHVYNIKRRRRKKISNKIDCLKHHELFIDITDVIVSRAIKITLCCVVYSIKLDNDFVCCLLSH